MYLRNLKFVLNFWIFGLAAEVSAHCLTTGMYNAYNAPYVENKERGISMIINILLLLLFGAVVGWLAGLIMKSKNSLFVNIILGIVGSLVGGFVASLLGFGSFTGNFSFNLVNVLISIGGACLVIFVVRLIRGK